jgi:hypothetical protein
MRKLLVAILALLYISTSSGAVVVHLHYCMGKLAGWGFGDNKSSTCGKCGMEKMDKKDNDCCKDEHKLLKNDSDQKNAETGFQMIQLLGVALPVSSIEISFTDFVSVTEESPGAHAPPRSSGVAVYIRNCVFLI